MEDALNSYNRRQDAIRRKHERLAKGYVTKLDRNGVYVQVPDSKVGGRIFRFMLISALVFLGFKALVLTWLGMDTYSQHVEALASGTMYERVGAWFMQVDPITANISGFASLLLS